MRLVSVGSIKDSNTKSLIENYVKMISKYEKIEIIEIKDEKIKNEDSLSLKDISQILNKEAESILKKIEGYYVITLEIEGNMLDSVSFSKKIDEIMTYQNKKICFVIGGSYGLAHKIKEKSDFSLSLSKMTFPHNLSQVILLEQIFRSFKILNHEIYHK